MHRRALLLAAAVTGLLCLAAAARPQPADSTLAWVGPTPKPTARPTPRPAVTPTPAPAVTPMPTAPSSPPTPTPTLQPGAAFPSAGCCGQEITIAAVALRFDDATGNVVWPDGTIAPLMLTIGRVKLVRYP